MDIPNTHVRPAASFGTEASFPSVNHKTHDQSPADAHRSGDLTPSGDHDIQSSRCHRRDVPNNRGVDLAESL